MSKFKLYTFSLWLVLCLPVLSGCQPSGKPEKATFNDLEDARKARFAVVTGNLHDLYVSTKLPEATPLRLDTYADVLMALEQGKADVACVEGIVFQTALKPKGIYRQIGVLFDDPYGIGFNKNNPELRDRFNAFLDEQKANGVLDGMSVRWIDQYQTARMPDLGAAPAGTPLRMGSCAATDVFDFMQEGRNAGFDIELIERFGRYIGRPVEYMTINFGGLIAALSSGKVDMIGSAITINEERAKQINFSNPYFVSQSIAIVMDRTQSVDLATAKVATMTGTTSEMYISSHYPKAELLLFDDINDAFMAIKTGKADYVFTSFTTSLLAAKNIPGLVILPEKYTRDPAAIAFNKKDTVLLQQVNGILQQFEKDGTLNDIVARWIKPDGANYQPEEIPAAGQGSPLKVGIAANREPMCFISDGKITGLDAELIERIAQKLGRPVEYMDMKFSALIAAIESGKVDLIISNFSPTEERSRRVNFSDEYFVNPQVLTVFSADAGAATVQPVQKSRFSRVRESFINNLVVEKRYMMILNGLQQTVIITFFAILLGTVIGGIICFLRMCKNRLLVAFARLYINVMRGTPILVLLMIFFYVIFATSGLSAAAVAIFTFALNMGAYSSEMFRTAIESVDRGQGEAGIAMGFSKIQTFIYIVFPQAIRRVIPVYKGEVISLLKMTSIVGYIAVVDLTKASDIIRSRTFDAFFPLIVVAVIYFLLAWLLGFALDKLNKKISSSK